jgi:hypothetical protein
MESINLQAAWLGVVAGMISGAAMGLQFHQKSWLGGYSSWSRRLVRLGHISFFGLAFVNFAYAFSIQALNIQHASQWASWLLIAGAISMPVVCALAAWRKPMRHLFPIPVLSLLSGVIIFLITGVFS